MSVEDTIVLEVKGAFDALVTLVEDGPHHDSAKKYTDEARDELIAKGYAIAIVVSGEEGYTAATQQGRNLYVRYYRTNTITQAKENRLHRGY